MNILFNQKEHLPPSGAIVKGIWNGNEYALIRLLGSGENGVVYLVQSARQLYAMKMSLETVDLSYEIQVIQQLNETQGSSLGFSVFDIDDFHYLNQTFSFYVMPYLKGIPIDKYLYGKQEKDYYHLFIKIIEQLNKIHQEGWCFGDLKPDHILIDSVSDRVTFLDLGGISRINESIRQFTELYDRGGWQAGNRRADPHYDFFSLAMIFIQMGLGKNKLLQIQQQYRSTRKVYDIIRKIPVLDVLGPILKDILEGKLVTSTEILFILKENKPKIANKNNSKVNDWINWLFTSSSILFIIMVIFFIYHW